VARTCDNVDTSGSHPGPLHVPSSDRHTLPSAYLRDCDLVVARAHTTCTHQVHASSQVGVEPCRSTSRGEQDDVGAHGRVRLRGRRERTWLRIHAAVAA